MSTLQTHNTIAVFRGIRDSRALEFIATGLCLGVSFSHPMLWWLGFLAVAYLFYSLSQIRRTRTVVLNGLLLGLSMHLVLFSWFWSTLPLDWLGIESGLSAVGVITLFWILSALPFALSKVAIVSAVHWVMRQKWLVWKTAFATATVWVVGEVFGSLLFSVFTLGPGIPVSATVTSGSLGYLLGGHGLLIWPAVLTGVFGLSFIVVCISYFLSYWYSHARTQMIVTASILLIVTSFVPYSNPYLNDSLSVAAIETTFPQVVEMTESQRTSKRETVLATVRESLVAGHQYIVLPEDSAFTRSFDSTEAVFVFMEAFGRPDAMIIDSLRTPGENVNENHVQAFIYDLSTRERYVVNKQMPIPVGEYMPYLYGGILRLFGHSDAVDRYASRVNTLPAETTQTDLPKHVPAVLFCFESASPTALRSISNGRPFVAHLVSHGWFNEPRGLWHQLDNMLAVNTLFGRTTVYQAANMYEAKRF